jgi:hypothetical protein
MGDPWGLSGDNWLLTKPFDFEWHESRICSLENFILHAELYSHSTCLFESLLGDCLASHFSLLSILSMALLHSVGLLHAPHSVSTVLLGVWPCFMLHTVYHRQSAAWSCGLAPHSVYRQTSAWSLTLLHAPHSVSTGKALLGGWPCFMLHTVYLQAKLCLEFDFVILKL